MMRKVTKIATLVMAFCMLFSTTAFAAEKDGADVMPQGESSTYAPAPALTEFYIYYVYSEDQPDGEYIQHTGSFYQTATALDHGGSWLRIVTYEHGYAGTRTAKFKNTSMKLEKTEGFDEDGDRIIDGYLCTWLYTGEFYTGLFSATSKSANSPWNTMNITNFNIR